MQASKYSGRRRSWVFKAARFAVVATLALAGSHAAQALAYFDEVTFYLTAETFRPGDTVSTTFTFGAKPGIDLSSFEFALGWDSPLATPVTSGPGSVADWAAALGAKGSVSHGFAGPQLIKGSWTADPSGGAASLIATDYATPVRAVFSFDTSPQLNTPFVVSIELINLKDANGEILDTGSGFINWATLSAVPAPGTGLSLVFGLAALAARRRAKQPA